MGFANRETVILGPIMGVFTAEYYLVRRQKVKLSDLYHSRPTGIYYFTHGINFRSFLSAALGIAPSIGGMASLNPNNNIPIGLTRTFWTGFITGYAISFLAQWGINAIFPPRGLNEVDTYDVVSNLDLAQSPNQNFADCDCYSMEHLPQMKLQSLVSNQGQNRSMMSTLKVSSLLTRKPTWQTEIETEDGVVIGMLRGVSIT